MIIDLKANGFIFQHNYGKKRDNYYGFDKDFSQEIVIKINQMPDEESIEQFKQDLEIVDEVMEMKADLRRKDDEGEDEGLKAIREHENCIDAENQENFCN